ncbi:P-loop containing nucleoside triphosphate hydrolase protein [Haematococcus lacustris]
MLRSMITGIERATQLPGLYRHLSGGRGKLRKLVDDPFAAHLPVDAATLECIRHWTISSCKFVKSSCSMDAMPPAAGPEFCFVGMSNAGKSSLINLLTGQERLANVSSKPGRTRVINHYLVNRRYCLVDCPGYGFAPVSKTEREAWNTVTQDYLLTRGPLAHVFLLIDATFPAHMLDIQAAMWLARKRVPHTLLFNKVDRPARPDDRALGDGAGDDEADGADDAWTMDAPSLTAVEHACMSAERSAVNKEWCANVSGGSGDEYDAAQNIRTCCAALRKLLSEQETELQEQWKQQGGAASSRLRPAQPPEHTPAYIVTSAKTRFGYATLLRYIAHMAEEWQRTAPVVFR